MANEVIWATLAQVTLQSSGASAASTAMVTAGTLATSMHSNYSSVDLVLTGTMAASVASTTNYFMVYARELDVDGTKDVSSPGASFKHRNVGILQISGSSASGEQTAILLNVPTHYTDVEFFIENLSNSSLNAGWTLKATPKTVKPS